MIDGIARRLALMTAVCMIIQTLGMASANGQCTPTDLLRINNMVGPILWVRWKSGASIPVGWVNTPPTTAFETGLNAAKSKWDAVNTDYSFASGSNVIYVYGPWPPSGDPRAGAAAEAEPGPSGYIEASTIWVRDEDVTWGHNCDAAKTDFPSVILHEVGHVLGLAQADPICTNTVMMPLLLPGDCRTSLFQNDKDAINSLYCGSNPRQIAALAQGSDYQAVFDCEERYPAAEINDFAVVNGNATWTALFEYETLEYVLEGCHTANGPGTALVTEGPGIGRHSVAVPTSEFPLIRLREVETSGATWVRGVSTTKESSSPRLKREKEMFTTEPLKDKIERIRRRRGHSWPSSEPRRASQTSLPICLIFTVTSYYDDVLSLVGQYWVSKGYQVILHNMSIWPVEDRADKTKTAIVNWWTAFGFLYVHIIADWGVENFVSPWEANPYWRSKRSAYKSLGYFPETTGSRDIIPTFVTPNAKDEPYDPAAPSRPYVASDNGYGDVDGDGVPDVVVTRWPVESTAELVAIADKMQQHNDQGVPQPYSASFFVGDVNSGSPLNSGEIARAMADEVENRLLEITPQEEIFNLYQTEFPGAAERDDTTAAVLNLYRPEMVALLAASSSPWSPGEFFNHAGFVNGLQPGTLVPLILANSCLTATREHSPFWEEVCLDFLFEPDKGAVAWVGATTGTWQYANYGLALYMVEELYQNPGRPMAESWLIAVQRALNVFADSPEHVNTINSYVFMGDPLSPFRPEVDSQISSFARKWDSTLHEMPDTFAVGCPQGDADSIVVFVAIDENDVANPIPQEAITISQPANSNIVLYTSLSADSAPALSAGYYRTTITVTGFGGCGTEPAIDSALVTLYNIPLGYAKLNVRSPDVVTSPAAKVELADLALFATHFPSTICDCVPGKLPYSSCVDFVPPDTTVQLNDLTLFSFHFNHFYSSGSGVASDQITALSSGTVAITFSEDYPLFGPRKLRAAVALNNVEKYTVAFISFKSENPALEFAGWHEDPDYPGRTAGLEVVRNGQNEIVLVVIGSKALRGYESNLGYIELKVDSKEPLTLTADDLAVVTAELLTIDGNALAFPSSQVQRSVRPTAFPNQLAQNYPNPFNPTTTIAFSIAQPSNVELKIYNVLGQLVRNLVNDRRMANNYKITWNGKNNAGSSVATGVYFYRLKAGTFTSTKKMVLLR